MKIDIRLPNITATTEKEQLQQVKSYLYQFAEQLRWAFGTIEIEGSATPVTSGTAQSGAPETSNESTFNSIKSLIIKSADIVSAYYDQINKRLKGEYVAQSDFGSYAQDTILDVMVGSESIEQKFQNLQRIDSKVQEINNTLLDSNAYVKSGLLYYNTETGTPVYGVEVGQTNEVNGVEVFNRYARFIPDRLSFYDQNSTEVAYVSNYKLYISNAEIRGNLKLNRYLADTTSGVAWKWV